MRLRALFLAISLCSPLGAAASSLKAGDEAPAFFIKDLDGNKHTLNPVSLVPGKPAPPVPVYLIDFFATWCKPCQALMPHLVELQKRYGEDKLRVLLVDYAEERDILAKFLKEKGITLAAAYDMRGAFLARRYGLMEGQLELPISVIIGRDKKIALFLGKETENRELALDRALEKILGPATVAEARP